MGGIEETKFSLSCINEERIADANKNAPNAALGYLFQNLCLELIIEKIKKKRKY